MNERRPFTCLGSRRQKVRAHPPPLVRRLLTLCWRYTRDREGMQEFLSGGEISHCLMWPMGTGGLNGVTRTGEDLREEKSPGNIKLRHMVADFAGPDWRTTEMCALRKSSLHIALTGYFCPLWTNLPNPFGFSISSEQHEKVHPVLFFCCLLPVCLRSR